MLRPTRTCTSSTLHVLFQVDFLAIYGMPAVIRKSLGGLGEKGDPESVILVVISRNIGNEMSYVTLNFVTTANGLIK